MTSLTLPRTLALLSLCLPPLAALAQSQPSIAQSQPVPASAHPAFEAAVIRENPSADPQQGNWSLPNIGSFKATGVSLALLIRLAYGIDAKQIANKPAWLDTKLFDVTAKPEPGIALSRAELRPRLQDLLQQRFHLVTHHETRDLPGYELVVAAHGPKLQPTAGAKFPNYRVELHDGKINLRNATLDDIAAGITSVIDKPVTNATNLPGRFDIDITYAADAADDADLPALFTAIQETIGLRLAPQKVPVEFLVIDSADPTPTPN